MKIQDILYDLTGEQVDDVENTMGCPIDDAPAYKLIKALGFVRAKVSESNPDLKFADYNKRTLREIRRDTGLDDAESDPKDDAGN